MYIIDSKNINSEKSLHAELANKFNFPSYYGKNFDALLDCLRDIADQAKLSNPIVVRFTDYFLLVRQLSCSDMQNLVTVFQDWKDEYPDLNIKITLEL